ncbi:uncharacterized protein LOC113388023 [Ctenocephalides felis]|nr:uncharacterized protein LOC113388023 [Ctenocephalides felis]
MSLLEQTNEKLRLANEKLTRQLDDTLVTRRHSEGITQLTEFEYLKNILYQYLSGGVGGVGANTNSTLIRVIAAVMKFDATQTQTVLDKEAQRNTLLGQLNLI